MAGLPPAVGSAALTAALPLMPPGIAGSVAAAHKRSKLIRESHQSTVQEKDESLLYLHDVEHAAMAAGGMGGGAGGGGAAGSFLLFYFYYRVQGPWIRCIPQ